ncbi:hypothetical protein [Streptomyces albireticuli]|uniref:Uncharacterized protein n=1 Tax=Streptomyces albireticuli TaxID=1940 RepID=A0A2A2CZN4_9ACTN|nr:hypothetical protein [Streptomyces albireticuli]MCD9145797.1 hypothetical protein [Streptomyces albireticuli]MCD9165874.1 hypothetical protein [Streptomyces albireticuli]MCD9194447.1 hypothetical protein [Streptomyces albireticuli]PAU44550.1 hypothetical protein CK936_34260 [Streptomyces albireticuli]
MTEQLIPPPPAHPPTIGAPAPDWWDDLYADEAPRPSRPVAPRLPDWWSPKPALPEPEADQDSEAYPEEEPAAEDDEPEPDPEANEPEEEPEEELEEPEQPREQRAPRSPIRAVLDTVTDDPKRRRQLELLAYNGSAAGTGWWLGIGPWVHDSLIFYGQHDTPNGVYVGCGVIAVAALAEIRSHNWRGPNNHIAMRLLGWLARIPLATAVLALALYTPDARF